MQPNLEDLLPTINEYLETIDDDKSVSIDGLDNLVYKVRAKTGLELEICALIVRVLFHEIRNAMLRGDIVTARSLGRFFITCPKNKKGKVKIMPVFKLNPTVMKKLNGR